MSPYDVQKMQNIACVMAEVARFNAEIESMKAANVERQIAGNSPAYGEAAFLAAIDRSGVHWNAVSETLQRGM
jgi:hypothetical protein